MGARVIFEYDRIGDMLYVGKCRPCVGQDSDNIEDMVIARFNVTVHV